MSRLALALLLLAAPVAAETIHHYEYEDVVVGTPVTLTGKSSIEVRLSLPPGVEGRITGILLKGCNTIDHAFGNGFEDPTLDEDITFYSHTRHPDRYTTTVIIGDRRKGRTQTYCPRLLYEPRP